VTTVLRNASFVPIGEGYNAVSGEGYNKDVNVWEMRENLTRRKNCKKKWKKISS
jgi:phage-related protein